ncbi:MAG: carboxypeptidase-like regulatory domain-containing protein [Myxococcota bacterium]
MRLTRRLTVLLLLPFGFARCGCEEPTTIEGAPGSLKGKLCDIRTGQGAAGVQVALQVPGEAGGSQRAESVAGGDFTLENVKPGAYEVIITQTFSNGGDQRVIPEVLVKSDEETEVKDPACIAGRVPDGTGWVRGRVCNRHTGSWVTNAAVTITLADGTLAQTTTNAEGDFLLEGVPEGDHTLYIQSSNYQRAYAITVIAGQETLLQSSAECRGVDPNSGGVEGLMCAPNGTGPLAGATAYIDVGEPPVRVADVLDNEGRFILTGLPPGVHQLHVQLGSYERVYDVTVNANEIVRVGPTVCNAPDPDTTGRIQGMFCNPNGGPLVDATVLVDVSNGTLEDSTDELGRFAFAGVEPGDRVVRVQHVSFTQQFPVTVVAGQMVEVVPQQVCEQNNNGPTGEIRGRICAPNGTTWLANARVWVDLPTGGVVETQTDPDGRFVLTGVPEGIYTVHVAAGSFTTDIPNVQVRPNEITEVGDSADQCVPIEDRKIAVVSGRYDRVQDVLNRLGLNDIDLYDGEGGGYQGSLLENYDQMQEYDVIFFNCGMDDSFLSNPALYQVAVDNLRAYVASGKSVYASDWAYDIIEVAWPDHVDFYADDGTRDTAQVASDGENLPATVTDAALRNALGTQNVAINYNLPAWALMSGASNQTTVYIRGTAEACLQYDIWTGTCADAITATNVPFTVGFHPSADSGKVIYTSFHQEQQTTQDMDTILELLVFEL